MEVKPGYKQTEAGAIPEDWGIDKLGNLSAFITSGSRGWARYYSDRGALFIRSQNVRDGWLDLADSQFVNPPQGSEGSRTRVNRNDLLITITGNSVGNVALVEHELGEAYISQHVGLVRLSEPSRGQYVCRFLCPGSPGNAQISASQSGQSKPGLTLRNLQDFWVVLPPLPEQRAIAGALSDVDALLGALDQLITKKRDLKQGAMQQLLTGQTRLPRFAKKGFSYKRSEVGVIPEDWRVVRIKEHASIKTGKRNTQDRVEDGEYPFFVRSQVVERIDSYSFDGEAVLTAGDGVGTGKVFHYINGRFDFHQRVYRISDFKPDLNGFFLFLIFSTHFYERIMSMTAKSSVDSVRLEMIADMQIPLPPTVAEQTAIAEVLLDMDAELSALEQRRAKTRALKQGMMQELLTGRTRLV